MGIIQRQGIKHAIVSYVGVAIGLLSVSFIYPDVIQLYGLFQLFLTSSLLSLSIFLLGFNIHAVKFFPVFQDEEQQHHGFFSFLIIGTSVGFLLFLMCFPFIKSFLLDFLFLENENRELFATYFNYLIPFVFLFGFNMVLVKYISNFHRIVVPNILDQLLIKITLPILALLFLGNYIDTDFFLKGVVLNYSVVFLGLIIYIKSLGQLNLKTELKFITKPLAKEMGQYSLYGLLNSLGSQLAFRIDTLMVAAMINISAGGVYTIVNVISEVIMKPSKSLIAIASPIISKSWTINDLKEIEMIYKKSSIVLLIVGCYIFLGIWGSIDDLINVMTNSEEIRKGKYVILFLGMAKLVDLGTSVNTEIIYFSKKFRFNFFAMIILAVLNIIFNVIFIRQYQMTGAALATFCSIFLFNLVKVIFIWFQFKMQPFSLATLKILALAVISWLGIYFISLDFHPIVNILLRSILLTIFYGSLALYLNISPDVNAMVRTGLEKVSSFFKK